jgi:TolB-like protein
VELKRHIRFCCAALAALIGITSLSCATSIPIQITKVPTMDTSGISRLAVMPFRTSDTSALQALIAQALTLYSEQRILETKRFIMVDPSQIARLQADGTSLTTMVDALFTGALISFTVIDSSHEIEKYYPETKTFKTVTLYERVVSLEYSYQLIRTWDNSIVDKIVKSGETSDSKTDKYELKKPYLLAQEIIDTTLRYLARDLSPWVVTEQIQLAQDTSKDKNIKNQMKEAERLVKEGSYQTALSAYNTLYTRTNNFAAGYNAAILIWVTGNLEGAIDRMQELAAVSGNPKAAAELAYLKQVHAESQTIEQKYTGPAESLSVSALRQVSEGIIQALSSNAIIMIMNVSQTEQDFVDSIIDGITAQIIESKTITVVDRQNRDLREAEQQFQLSGSVSDDSAVSIGHELGVSVIITCALTGTGTLRRLTVKAIDVETGKITYQVSPKI